MIKIYSKVLIVITLTILFASCSNQGTKSSKFRLHDDVLRISNDSAYNYGRVPDTSYIRNGKALRGKVESVDRKLYYGKDSSIYSRTTIKFVDSIYCKAYPDGNIPYNKFEYISYEALDTVFYNTLKNNNIKNNDKTFKDSMFYVENYNNPLNFRMIREIKINIPKDSIPRTPDSIPLPKDCGCQPLELNGPKIDCPSRIFSDYLVEAKIGYAAFTDKLDQISKMKGTDANFAELVLAYRYGDKKQWALGLAYSSGVPLANQFSGERITRPIVMLHGKKTFDRFFCLFPFTYAQFGVALDKLTLDLGKISLSDDCSNKLKLVDPGLDLSIPLSYGFGFGLDIPVVPYMDLSIDLGYRSLAFGESRILGGFSNVPSQRRVNMLLLRFGVSF
ncbi:MAG: hypothetical protein NTW25_04145 [Candidatus Kapabacteria bacterium]|nr:hypothetical protein [Candidatus Kapabacteria bacterium]